jgi:hypothetical protein
MGLVGQACAMAAGFISKANAPTTAAMQVRRPRRETGREVDMEKDGEMESVFMCGFLMVGAL